MPRLTERQKAEVITDFAAGKSKTDISQKFKISITAVSKILNNQKSLESAKKFTKSSAELRKDIIDKATIALYGKDFEDLPSETLLKIIERLSILESNSVIGSENDLKIVVEKKIVDLTKKDGND